MSTSTEAMIFYGFAFFSAEHSREDIEDEDLYDRLHRLIDEDCVEYPEQGKKAGDVAMGWSGDLSDSCVGTWHHVYIIGSEIMGYNFPTEFDPANMMTSEVPHWRERLREFCEKNEIPWEEPGWRLTVQRG